MYRRALLGFLVALFIALGASVWAENVEFMPKTLIHGNMDSSFMSVLQGPLKNGKILYLILGSTKGADENTRFVDSRLIYIDGKACGSHAEVNANGRVTWYKIDVTMQPNSYSRDSILNIPPEVDYVGWASNGFKMVSDERPRVMYADSVPSGAELFVDGRSQGVCPKILNYDGPVSLSLRFSLKGYADKIMTVDMWDKTTEVVTADMGSYDMERRNYTLKTSPTVGASVYVNGGYVGVAGPSGLSFYFTGRTEPFSVRLSANGVDASYSVSETRAGSWSLDYTFDAEPRAVALSSSPSAANISCNGKALGAGKAATTVYGPGPHAFSCALNGRSSSFSFPTPEKKGYAFDMAFDAEPRTLRLQLNVKGASVSLNGTAVGSGSGSYTVYEPSLRLSIRKEGYKSHEETISVQGNSSVRRTVFLQADYPYRRGGMKTSGFHLGASAVLVRRPVMADYFPILAGVRFGDFMTEVEKPFFWEFGLDCAYGNTAMRLVPGGDGFGGNYYDMAVYGSLGLKAWLGSAGYVYAKTALNLGMAGGDLSIPDGYRTTGDYSLSIFPDDSYMGAYAEGELALGICLQGKKDGLYAEAGLRPAVSGGAWSFSPVVQGGFFFGMR
jgi:hypothetical protein